MMWPNSDTCSNTNKGSHFSHLIALFSHLGCHNAMGYDHSFAYNANSFILFVYKMYMASILQELWLT